MNDKIQQQLHEYKQQREQLRAQLQAINGAIQALERLLKEKENDNGD